MAFLWCSAWCPCEKRELLPTGKDSSLTCNSDGEASFWGCIKAVKDGFIQLRRFTQDDISQEQAENFNEVVARVAVLSDAWKALQVWAYLDRVISSPGQEGETFPESRDAVALTVEAANVQGGWRLFISRDDAEFMIMDGAAVALPNHFTTINDKK